MFTFYHSNYYLQPSYLKFKTKKITKINWQKLKNKKKPIPEELSLSPIYLNFLNSCRSLRIQVRIKRKSYAFNYEFTCLGSGLPKNAFFHSFILELRTITKLMLANCWTHGPRCVFVCESDSSSRLRLSYRSLSSHACFFSLFQISLRLAHLLPPSIASHNKCHVKLKLRMFWIRSRVRSMISSVYQSIHLVCRWTNKHFLFFFKFLRDFSF